MTAFLWRLRVIGLRGWPRPLAVICFTQRQTECGWWAHPRYVKGCQRARARMVSTWGTISQQARWVFFTRAPSGSTPKLAPLLPRSAQQAHKILARTLFVSHPPPYTLHLTSVDGAEETGYKHLPPLDESVAAHLCLPMAIGWKARATHPSKPCRATSALAEHAYSAAGQSASALHSIDAGLDSASLRDLRSATDLALRATKATAQAIGCSMSNLIVLDALPEASPLLGHGPTGCPCQTFVRWLASPRRPRL